MVEVALAATVVGAWYMFPSLRTDNSGSGITAPTDYGGRAAWELKSRAMGKMARLISECDDMDTLYMAGKVVSRYDAENLSGILKGSSEFDYPKYFIAMSTPDSRASSSDINTEREYIRREFNGLIARTDSTRILSDLNDGIDSAGSLSAIVSKAEANTIAVEKDIAYTAAGGLMALSAYKLFRRKKAP